MSLYRKAWLFMAWTMILFLAAPFWLLWPASRWGFVGALPGMILWLAHGVASLWLFGVRSAEPRHSLPGRWLTRGRADPVRTAGWI
jgi:hypothetical protein